MRRVALIALLLVLATLSDPSGLHPAAAAPEGVP